MALHLLKMCVGIENPDHLRERQLLRLEERRAAGLPLCLFHWTRNMPRRADEVIAGGSIYWIMKGMIRARQSILSIEKRSDAPPAKPCALELSPDVIETRPTPMRPIQGWRYFSAADAPPDLVRGDQTTQMPDAMAKELRDLGLL